jgi:hypothetical protein
MKKRQHPERRTRVKVDRLTNPNRSLPASVVRVYPDPRKPFIVEVRIARTRRHMREEMRRKDNAMGSDLDPRTQGMVRSWHHYRSGLARIRPGGLIARMYLNVSDLRARPSEIVSHEAAHAALAWGRIQRANLRHMDGEEVVCHAVGQLVRQINHHCFAQKVWT